MANDPSYTKQKFKVIGSRVRRPDGIDKVTGRAKYGADHNAPGQLVGLFLRSPGLRKFLPRAPKNSMG